MKDTTLVIMAAGIGSRFGGGIKQLAPVGPGGEIIMVGRAFRANRPDWQFRSSQSISGLRHLRSYPASGRHEKQSMYHCGKHQPEFANLSIL